MTVIGNNETERLGSLTVMVSPRRICLVRGIQYTCAESRHSAWEVEPLRTDHPMLAAYDWTLRLQ